MSSLVVISDCLPSRDSTSGSILLEVVNHLPTSWQVSFFVIRNPYLPREHVLALSGLTVREFSEPQSDWNGAPALVREIGERAADAECTRLAKELQGDLLELSPDFVVVLPQTHTVARLASLLFREEKKAKKVAIMTDHPSWWSRARGLSPRTRDNFESDWMRLFKASDCRVLPSQRAVNLFSKDPGRNVILYPTFAPPSTPPDGKAYSENATIRIVFAGQDYARLEIERFVESLSSLRWKLFGKSVEFHHYGATNLTSLHSNHVLHGRVDAMSLIDTLASYDFAFLPYSSQKEMALVGETSFPSKLGTYVAAGLPVIYSGPKESSVWDFINTRKIGIFETDFLGGTGEPDKGAFSKSLQSCYEVAFSVGAFRRSVMEIFDHDGSEPPKLAVPLWGSRDSKRIGNSIRSWSSPGEPALLIARESRFSFSRMVRFLFSPIWLARRGLPIIQANVLGGIHKAARRLVRTLGRMNSSRHKLWHMAMSRSGRVEDGLSLSPSSRKR